MTDQAPKCGCFIDGPVNNTTFCKIVYCPLHASAPELLEALKNVKVVLGPTPLPDCCEGAKTEMEMAIEYAEEAIRLAEEKGKP